MIMTSAMPSTCEREARAAERDPLVRLAELEPGAAGLERDPHRDAEAEHGERPDERDHLRQLRLAPRHERDDERPDERRERQHAQIRESVHHAALLTVRRPRERGGADHPTATANIAATTSTAPPSMDSAYVRTKPVCARRSRPEPPPTRAARPLTDAVEAPVVEVDERAGQVDARLLEDRLVERVAVEVVAGRRDDRTGRLLAPARCRCGTARHRGRGRAARRASVSSVTGNSAMCVVRLRRSTAAPASAR